MRHALSDLCFQDFLIKLKNHILHRIKAPGLATENEDYPPAERRSVIIQHNRIFRHKVLRINYTSYDIRRGQDSVNPRTRANVMIPAFDLDPDTGESPSGHPYLYARILGVFHADVTLNEHLERRRVTTHTLEFLWVRWYRIDPTFKGGFAARRLHRIQFIPEEDPDAFGFLDPDDIIRAVHIIPAFEHGTIEETSGYLDEVWKYYYVNLYVYIFSTITLHCTDKHIS